MMSEPIAYHITWRTHGSWLPGDDRGWVKNDILGIQEPSQPLEDHARSVLPETPTPLCDRFREIVESTIRDHCRIRNWTLHAVNARSNHVHAVVSAEIAPELVMNQLKAWCSRRLNQVSRRDKWWAGHGSTRWINDLNYLEEAIQYVLERQ